MIYGICSLIYPVKDVVKSKELFTKMLGVTPNYDDPHYVGFQVGGSENDFTYQEIGLSLNEDTEQTGPSPYLRVKDIKESLKQCLDAGATLREDIHEVSGGLLMASVIDFDGNPLGLIQFAPSKPKDSA